MIRKAKIYDAQDIYRLISSWAKKNRLLNRSLSYIYEHIRDFWVYQTNKKIVGCCALHIVGWDNLAEIKCLAVNNVHSKKGIGKLLVRQCLVEAKEMDIKKIFALTFVSKFFKKQGFKKIDKKKLPHKIWSDCVNCAFFPDCNEEAMIIKI